jgi:acetoacetyl-CoA reductase
VLDKIVAGIPVKRLGTGGHRVDRRLGRIGESGFATGAEFSVNGGLHMG